MGVLKNHKSQEPPKGGSSPSIQKLLRSVRGSVVSKYGKDILVTQSEIFSDTIVGKVRAWIRPKIQGLERVLGRESLGIPLGKLIEISGAESHGKSALCYYLLGQIQAAGGVAVLFDTETSFDPVWGAKLGIDCEELILISPTDGFCIELCFEMIRDITLKIRKKNRKVPVFMVVDTIYCCPTEAQLDDGSFLGTNKQFGPLATALNAHLPKLCNFIKRYDVGLVFVNQIRDNIGVRYGEKYKTPGGHALLHMAQIRARVKRIHKKTKGAIESSVVNIKNKISTPFEAVNIEINPNGLQVSKTKSKQSEEDI